MKYTQILILEIGHICNLEHKHPACPIASRRESMQEETLTQEERVQLAVDAYEHYGFRGIVGFHNYNEPMLRAGEMLSTMERIKIKVPSARFRLLTNGTITPKDWRLTMFDQIECSNYDDNQELEPFFRSYCNHVVVNAANGHWTFDARMADWRANPIENTPCLRPLIEFIVDDWGNGRLCCQDWRGDVSFGNVRNEGLRYMLRRRSELLESICKPMSDFTPERCRRCNAKTGAVPFDPTICQEGETHYRRA